MSFDGRILVADDDAVQREMLAGFLRDLGSEVLEAEDGTRALEKTRLHNPDVVITDLRMPGMDGHQLLKEIVGLNPEIRTILVTAYGTVQGAVACLKDGAFDYLLKPLELEEVEHAVRRALEERHLRRENRELRLRLGRIGGAVTAEIEQQPVRGACETGDPANLHAETRGIDLGGRITAIGQHVHGKTCIQITR